MAGKFEEDTFSSFVSGIGESAKRLKTNFESIFEKYGKQFPDDDLVDLLNMKISRDKGRLRKYKGSFTYGASRLKSTKRRDEIFRKLTGSKHSSADPDVSSAIADRCVSVLNDTVDTRDEDTSDAETLSSDSSEDCAGSKENSLCEILDSSGELNNNEDDIENKEKVLEGGVLDYYNESKDDDCGSKSREDEEDDDGSKDQNDIERNEDDLCPVQSCDIIDTREKEFHELYDSTKEVSNGSCHSGTQGGNVLLKNASPLSQQKSTEFLDSSSFCSDRPRQKSESLAFVSISSPVRKHSPTGGSGSTSFLNSSRSTSLGEKRSPKRCPTFLIEKYSSLRSNVTNSETNQMSAASAHESQRFQTGNGFLISPERTCTSQQRVKRMSPQNLKERILLETSVASSPEAHYRKRSAVDVNMNVLLSLGNPNVVNNKSPATVELPRKGTKRIRTLSSSEPEDESCYSVLREQTSPHLKNSFSPGLSASFRNLDLRKGFQEHSPASLHQRQTCDRKATACKRVPQKACSEVQRSDPAFSPEVVTFTRSPCQKNSSQCQQDSGNNLQGVRRSLSHYYSFENQKPISVKPSLNFSLRSAEKSCPDDMVRMKPQIKEFSSSSGFSSSDDSLPPAQSHACFPSLKHVSGKKFPQQITRSHSHSSSSGIGKHELNGWKDPGSEKQSQEKEAAVISPFRELPLRPPIRITKVQGLKERATAFTKTYFQGTGSPKTISVKHSQRRPGQEAGEMAYEEAGNVQYLECSGEASRGNYVENWVAASSGDTDDVAYHFASCPPKVPHKWTPAPNGGRKGKDLGDSPRSIACQGRTRGPYNGTYKDTHRFRQQVSGDFLQSGNQPVSISQSSHKVCTSPSESRHKRLGLCGPSYRTVQSTFSGRSALDCMCPSMNPSPSAFTDFRHRNSSCRNHKAKPSLQTFTSLRPSSLTAGQGQVFHSDHMPSHCYSQSELAVSRPFADSPSGWMDGCFDQQSLYSTDSKFITSRQHQERSLPHRTLSEDTVLRRCCNCSSSPIESVPEYWHSHSRMSSNVRTSREALYGSFQRARGDGQVSSNAHKEHRANFDRLSTNEIKFNSLYERAFDAWREIQMKIPAEGTAFEEIDDGTTVDDSCVEESCVLSVNSPSQHSHVCQNSEIQRNLPVVNTTGHGRIDISKLMDERKMLSCSFVEKHSTPPKPGVFKPHTSKVNTQNLQSKRTTQMFPPEYIERFSPLNPNRIDSDSSNVRNQKRGIHKTNKATPRSQKSLYLKQRSAKSKYKETSFPSPVFRLYSDNPASLEQAPSSFRSHCHRGKLYPPQHHSHRDVIDSTFTVCRGTEPCGTDETDVPPPVFKVPTNTRVFRRTSKGAKQFTSHSKPSSFKRASTPVPRTSQPPVMTLDDSLSTIYDCKDSAVADTEWETDREEDIDLV